jgi:hypothetical protein
MAPGLVCLAGSLGPLCYHAEALDNEQPSVGAWRSLVARVVRDDKVGGSNPLAPTTSSEVRQGASQTGYSRTDVGLPSRSDGSQTRNVPYWPLLTV